MNTKTKRKIASRLLLAVLLPMLVLSSLHIHPLQPFDAGGECADCVQHHCGGHVAQQVKTFHDCVLCQFLSLPMAVATEVDVVPVNNVCESDYARCQQCLLSLTPGVVVTRGPPGLS